MGEEETGEKIKTEHLVPLRYADPVTKQPTTRYPLNPNGSWDAAAALCDPSGHILGLMPHPEAYLDRTNHPRWTRDEVPREGLGLAIFRNAIAYLNKTTR